MEQKWLVLKDEDWTVVMPETDIEAHSDEGTGTERALAWAKCPCGPLVIWDDQMIVHNSFLNLKSVREAMERLTTP